MATHIPMNVSRAQPGHGGSWRESFDRRMPGLEPRPKAMLLGLPCSRCGAYYAAELDSCPICRCTARVSSSKQTATVVM